MDRSPKSDLSEVVQSLYDLSPPHKARSLYLSHRSICFKLQQPVPAALTLTKSVLKGKLLFGQGFSVCHLWDTNHFLTSHTHGVASSKYSSGWQSPPPLPAVQPQQLPGCSCTRGNLLLCLLFVMGKVPTAFRAVRGTIRADRCPKYLAKLL